MGGSPTADQKHSLADVVIGDQEIRQGTPCFTGTRVPARTLLDDLGIGLAVERLVADFLKLKREQALRFLRLGKEQLLASVSS